MSIVCIAGPGSRHYAEEGGGGAGDLAHGELFTISGSGFGSRADHNLGDYTFAGHRHMHRIVADLEGATLANGQSQTQYLAECKGLFPAANHEFVSSMPGISIQSGGPSQSGKFLRKISSSFASTGYLLLETDGNTNTPDNPTAYCCFKHRGDGQGKIFRWWQISGGSSGRNFYIGRSESEYNIFRETDSGGAPSLSSYVRDATTWRRNEIWIRLSPGVQVRVEGSSAGSTYAGVASDESSRNLYVSWPNSVDSGGVFDYADIVFDFTFARVEVSVGSLTEFCPVTSWSGTSITAVYNKGAMGSGTAMIRVYDASNTVIHTESRQAS